MIFSFCFGYLLISHYGPLLLNMGQIQVLRVTPRVRFLWFSSYIYIYICMYIHIVLIGLVITIKKIKIRLFSYSLFPRDIPSSSVRLLIRTGHTISILHIYRKCKWKWKIIKDNPQWKKGKLFHWEREITHKLCRIMYMSGLYI